MDFGIIVDGAVIVVENVFRSLARGAKPGPPARLQKRSSSRRRGRPADAVLDADHHRRAHPDLHAAAARRPDLRADGLVGRPRRWSARCFFSLTLVPLLCLWLLRKQLPHEENPSCVCCKRAVSSRSLAWALGHRQIVDRRSPSSRWRRASPSVPQARHRIPAGAQRGLDLDQRAAPAERVGDGSAAR